MRKSCSHANFGHKLIHHLDDGSSLDLIEPAIREIVKIWNFNSDNKPNIELAIDGQLSNWVLDKLPAGEAFDSNSLFWKHEMLHRLVLKDYHQ